FKLFDPSGKDVTSEYDIRYIPGILEVFPADQEIIPVYLYQLQQFYNGKPLAFEEGDYEIEMPDGYRVNLKLNISLTEVGELTLSTLNANISKYVSTFNVYESDTMEEVTSDYRIVFEADSAVPIKVDPRGITLISESETKVYDGTPLSNGNVFISIGSLANGHRLEYQTSGSITAPGRSPNIISSVVIFDAAGNDVTKNYDITQKYGILEIIPVQ
ncbi:MAG: hypothetical protein IJA86_02535, partial [Clostridia bacterium]|nr:hypothetical protein [Clostridia bacterium]